MALALAAAFALGVVWLDGVFGLEPAAGAGLLRAGAAWDWAWLLEPAPRVGLAVLSCSLAIAPRLREILGHSHPDPSSSRRPAPWPSWLLATAALALLGCMFLAGAIPLAERFADAERDARRVAGVRAFERCGRPPAQAISVAERCRASPDASLWLIEARVTERIRDGFSDSAVLEDVRPIMATGMREDGPLPERIRLELPRPDAADAARASGHRAAALLWPGARVRLGVRIRPLEFRRNPGASDRARAYARRGLAAAARLVDPDWVLAIEHPEDRLTDRFQARAAATRGRLRARIARRLEATGLPVGLARALALGDRSGLSADVREALRALGLAHLIAVSGLHVGFVAIGMAAFLLRGRALVRHALAEGGWPFGWLALAASLVAFSYAWMAGSPVSAWRAALLLALVALARRVGVGLRPREALGWVALVILCIDPALLFDVGAQLSFLACAGIVAAGAWPDPSRARPHPAAIARVRTHFDSSRLGIRSRELVVTSLRVSLAVGFATAPVLSYAGLPVPLWSPLLNLVAVAITGGLVLPMSIVAALVAEVVPPGALRWLLLPAAGLEWSLEAAASRLPAWSPIDRLPPVGVPLTSIAGLCLLRFGRGWRIVLPLALAWGLISIAGTRPALHGRPFVPAPRAIFFDVGQGDAALLQHAARSVLIDTGPGPPDGSGGRALHRSLRALGVRSLAALAITHADLDHRGGAQRLLSSLPIAELWLPAGRQRDRSLALLAAQARRRRTRVRWLAAGSQPLHESGWSFSVLWPPAELDPRTSRNDASLVLRATLDGRRFLFSADVGGDVEARLLERPSAIAAEVLKLGHHGSRSSSTTAFLSAVAPSVVVLSAPCRGSRGLPSGVLLDRLSRQGLDLERDLAWTGRSGAISIGLRGGSSPIVERWAQRRRCPGEQLR